MEMVDEEQEQIISEQLHEVDRPASSSSEQGDIIAVEMPAEMVVELPARKRPEPRDEYDFNPQEGSPPKRLRRKGRVAKAPIVEARTSKGPVSSKLRVPTKSAAPRTNGKSSQSTAPSASIRESDEAQRPAPKKRGRGRPPKEDASSLKSTKHVEAIPDSKDTKDNTAVQREDPFEGLTDIRNPSPAKPSQDPRRAEKSRPRTKAVPIQLTEVSDDDAEELVNEEENNGEAEATPEAENLQGQENVDGEEEEYEAEEGEAEHQEDAIHLDAVGITINTQDLRAMHEIANRVGCATYKGEWRWKKDKVNTREKRAKLLTQEGKGAQKRINKLVTSYEMLDSARRNTDRAAYLEALDKHGSVLAALRNDIDQLIESQLRNPDGENKVACLYDVYYNIIPGLLKLIVGCAEMKTIDGSLEDQDLQELVDLVNMSWKLAKSAGEQDGQFQPRSKSYEIARPTAVIEPQLRILLRKLKRELNSREKAAKKVADKATKEAARKQRRIKLEQRRAEQERIRLEDEERDRLEQEREQISIHKSQRATFIEKFKDPVSQKLYLRELEKIEKDNFRRGASAPRRTVERDEEEDSDDPFVDDALRPARQKSRSAVSSGRGTVDVEDRRQTARSTSHQNHDDLEQDQDLNDENNDEIDDEEAEEEVVTPAPEHVFGSNNVNNPGKSTPFSDEELQTFINIMKAEYGNQEKHQVAAETLNRSLDEVFALAKEFQETMNACHENGQFCSDEDQWTMEVWMAPNSEPS